ncbi:hypothetical protein BDV27DRAFT_163870 [Aspergillus caelatus]|uniref:NADPH--cytochrome P450 reductase n=1 Tax=Aspergillus caelatus TaxID=61420 RepID=A0A5N6ZL60_9EURO|nr:uncharacterized protein BDV27DRAFT_163870 [Aspergillus caelatus]KAE8358128.1 hypothetical protein BDV27DRAFT_163870 [Aspergillus caelatus]
MAFLYSVLLASFFFLLMGQYQRRKKNRNTATDPPPSSASRSVVETMRANDKNCVVFYGSQTGTAEIFASRLAKEGSQRFGLRTMLADLGEYDYDDLRALPPDTLAFFILATYGEGEPTDNAVNFYDTLQELADEDNPLSSMRYVVFGLGNDNYANYNAVARKVDARLASLGATRASKVGEGNDATGMMEDHFMAWKEEAWMEIREHYELEESAAMYHPHLAITESPSAINDSIYLGELNKSQLEGRQDGPFSSQNPFLATIVESRELFQQKDRNCLHVEIDIASSGMRYETGDHVAIWPVNPGKEVDCILQVFGLKEKRNTVIDIQSLDPTVKNPIPTPTTYDAAFRYYLDICAPVSRQLLTSLAHFAPDEDTKSELHRLGKDKDAFHQEIISKYYSTGYFLQSITNKCFYNVPFSLLLENIARLQPRFYSISSSAQTQPRQLSITTIVDSVQVLGSQRTFKGLTTNYLYALKCAQNKELAHDDLNYDIGGPRTKYCDFKIPIYVRHSNFRLPSDTSRPIIMVGPGTGIAPFRAFIQERVNISLRNAHVGESLLFFGCRNRRDDFLYEEELTKWESDPRNRLRVIVAFSRETEKKVYVQHKLHESAVLVNQLVDQGAYIYICGDGARMAREVKAELGHIIAEQRGMAREEGDGVIKSMKDQGRYQEDVW